MIDNFKNFFSGIFSGDIAIDLGTANTIIWMKGEGIVLNEPSVVARNIVDDKIIAVGDEAKQMLGRTNPKIETIRPLKDGVIADYKMTDAMIQGFMRKISRSRISRPRIVICIPSGVTDVEQRSVRESAEHANASEVHLIEEPMAAAIGIGLDVSKPVGNMIVDIGGGTTEIAVISLNGIGAMETIKVAGDKQTLAIVGWFKSQHARPETSLNVGAMSVLFGGHSDVAKMVGGAVGASAAPALSNIPFIGWVAAGFVTMFGADKGGDIGADLSASYAGCDDVDVPHTKSVSYTHLRAHETGRNLVCRLSG